MITYTPGPWKREGGFSRRIKSEHMWIAECCWPTAMPHKERFANARLLAAAPELLEVCKVAVECLAGYDSAWIALSPAQRSLVNLLKETIQKAEGTI